MTLLRGGAAASAVRAVLRNKVIQAAQQARDETGIFTRLQEAG
jgi:hypothetical protein